MFSNHLQLNEVISLISGHCNRPDALAATGWCDCSTQRGIRGSSRPAAATLVLFTVEATSDVDAGRLRLLTAWCITQQRQLDKHWRLFCFDFGWMYLTHLQHKMSAELHMNQLSVIRPVPARLCQTIKIYIYKIRWAVSAQPFLCSQAAYQPAEIMWFNWFAV